MKKILLAAIIAATLSGCSTTDLMRIDGRRYFQILQVLEDKSFLATSCKKFIPPDMCTGTRVFMPAGTDPMPYNDKIIHLKNP